MNKNIILFIKNFSYTLSSNLVSLIISIVVIAIMPKFLGVKDYGYWQLYLFYTLYTALLHFGWNDGVYLRYGGKKYEELDKNLFFSQFWMLFVFELLITFFIILLSGFFINNSDRQLIFIMMLISSLLIIPRGMLLFVLQATNRMKENAIASLLGKVTYALLIMLVISFGVKVYPIMIAADLIGKFISLVYTTFICKDIVFRKITFFYISIKEAIENIRVGMKISIAFIASTLIIGTVRFGIEYIWDIETFGKVSLTLSISNLMMVFITALGIIIFPVLRRTNEKKLPSIYKNMRNLLTIPLLGILVVYYPLKGIMNIWLPAYKESLVYMGILFPIALYEGKMELLINPYLKTLRKEKQVLFINIISVSLSVIFTFISVFFIQNLIIMVFSIIILLAFRCVVAEIFICKILKLNLKFDVFLELFMTLVFISITLVFQSWLGTGIYLLFYIIYLTFKKSDISKTIRSVKYLLKT